MLPSEEIADDAAATSTQKIGSVGSSRGFTIGWPERQPVEVRRIGHARRRTSPAAGTWPASRGRYGVPASSSSLTLAVRDGSVRGAGMRNSALEQASWRAIYHYSTMTAVSPCMTVGALQRVAEQRLAAGDSPRLDAAAAAGGNCWAPDARTCTRARTTQSMPPWPRATWRCVERRAARRTAGLSSPAGANSGR